MTQISERRCWQAGSTSGTGRGDSERNGAGRLVALAGKVTREGAGRLVALAGEKKLEKIVFFFLPSSVINYVGGIPPEFRNSAFYRRPNLSDDIGQCTHTSTTPM